MTGATAQNASRLAETRPFALTVALVAVVSAIRVAALFATPLELYPDEAQYWAWSRELAFGYFSKPPLIAWLIHLTTLIGGDEEPWIRLSAPLLHAGAALALHRVGTRLYGEWTGFWAAALYTLMPGVQLSAGVIATDAPLLFFSSLALWAYAGLIGASSRAEKLRCAVGLGAAFGLAFLSKYAALYLLAGLVLHAVSGPEARRAWGVREVAVAAALGLVLIAPNLVWNAANDFATVGHIMANTDWVPPPDEAPRAEPVLSLDLRQTPGFVLSQLGVFGPVPFLVLVGGTIALARRRALAPADRLLLAFVAPPLAVVLVQAMVARANANWAGAAYAPASVLVAAWLVRWQARRWVEAAVASQIAAAVVFILAAVFPPLADRWGLANSFKRTRGWAASTAAVEARTRAEPGLTAVAVDDRFLFNAMTYYGRDYFGARGAPPLTMWMRRPWANTQAEIQAPLTAPIGARVLAVGLDDGYLREMERDFRRRSPVTTVAIPLDARRRRTLSLFVGEALAKAPRDPGTGLPIPPPSPKRALAPDRPADR